MKKVKFKIGALALLHFAFVICNSASATTIYFPVAQMTGNATDITINVRAVNNPTIWNNTLYYLPKDGTNLVTSGGFVTNVFVPGTYTATIPGLGMSWTIYVTNSASTLNAMDLARGLVKFSQVQTITGPSVSEDGYGNYTITASGGGDPNAITNNNAGDVVLGAELLVQGVTTVGNNMTVNGNTYFGGVDNWIDSIGRLHLGGGTLTSDAVGNLTAPSFTGNGSGINFLNASSLATGTVPAARLPATINSDTTGNAATANTANTATSAGNASTATYVTTARITNGISGNVSNTVPQSTLTNASVFLGNGGLQLPAKVYGMASGPANFNDRQGIEFMTPGWNGRATDIGDISPGVAPLAFVRAYTNWGTATGPAGNVLHIGGPCIIRLEPGFGIPGSSYYGKDFLNLGNEDYNGPVRVTYEQRSTYTSGSEQSTKSGYSLPLVFETKSRVSGNSYFGHPGIRGVGVGTGSPYPSDGVSVGELEFYSRVPQADTSDITFGQTYPDEAISNGKMLTNGWRFHGPVNFQQRDIISDQGTNCVLDMNLMYAQTIRLLAYGTNNAASSSYQSNYVWATNWNVYLGTTNVEPRIFRFIAGGSDRYIRWPSEWSVVSESGTATLPTVLAANKVLQLRLTGWGIGQTNIVAQFGYGNDATWAYDSDAQAFFTAASISDSTQKAAVDYLVKALKATNLWTKCSRIYPFVGGSATPHRYNLKSATTSITWSGSITHNANGVTGDGSAAYGVTDLTHSGAQNSEHIIVYNRTTVPTADGRFVSAISASNVRNGLGRNGNGATFAIEGPMNGNALNGVIDVSADFRGFLAQSRTDANAYYAMTRSASFSASGASSGAMDRNYAILAIAWNDGNYYNNSDANLAFVSIGDGLTLAELTAYRNIVNNYEALLGRNVP